MLGTRLRISSASSTSRSVGAPNEKPSSSELAAPHRARPDDHDRGSSVPKSRCSRCSACLQHRRDTRPSARAMKRGVPPTARNARTGEFTPPGMTFCARSKSCAFVGHSSARRAVRSWVPRARTAVRPWMIHARSAERSSRKFARRAVRPSVADQWTCRGPFGGGMSAAGLVASSSPSWQLLRRKASAQKKRSGTTLPMPGRKPASSD